MRGYLKAKAAGLRVYTGKPCPVCWGQLRYTSNRHCLTCSTWGRAAEHHTSAKKRQRARQKARRNSPLANLVRALLRPRT